MADPTMKVPDAGFWVDNLGPTAGGAVVLLLVLAGYRNQLAALFGRLRSDPVADAVISGMAAQTTQFVANNGLFQQVVALLTGILETMRAIYGEAQKHTAQHEAQLQALHELMAIQRDILTETRIAAAVARERK